MTADTRKIILASQGQQTLPTPKQQFTSQTPGSNTCQFYVTADIRNAIFASQRRLLTPEMQYLLVMVYTVSAMPPNQR